MRLLAFITVLLVALSTPALAERKTAAKQAFVTDFETGQVLLAKNAYEQMPTSSMSKVMTTYMVFDALKNGTIDLDTKFTVSEKAWRKGGSKMFVEQGKKVKVIDLLRGVIVQSGNDATIVLAEGLSSSEDAFSKSMTEKAKELGMENSNFVNASGWPDPDHYSTAHDLAIMTKKIIEDFPDYYKYFAEKEFSYNSINQPNRNPLLFRDIGADGLKTGHTEAGGYGLIGTAQRDGRRVIMVINGLENEKERASESVKLIEWGLNNFENMIIAEKGKKITDVKVAMGQNDSIPLVIDEQVKLTIPKASKKTFTATLQYKSPMIAPIKKGDEVGQIIFNIPDMGSSAYPLIAGETSEELGFFQKTFAKMKYFLFRAL